MVLISSFGSSFGFSSFSATGSSFFSSCSLTGLGLKSILPNTEGPDNLSAFATILSTFYSGFGCSSFDIVITVLSSFSILTLSAFSFSNFSL